MNKIIRNIGNFEIPFNYMDYKRTEEDIYDKQGKNVNNIITQFGYGKHNTCIERIRDEDIPDKVKKWVDDNFDFEFFNLNIMVQPPGNFVVRHIDYYNYLLDNYEIKSIDDVTRYVVQLTEWELGQYVGFEDEVFYKWKVGDTIQWIPNITEHMSCNGGLNPRAILVITGVLK